MMSPPGLRHGRFWFGNWRRCAATVTRPLSNEVTMPEVMNPTDGMPRLLSFVSPDGTLPTGACE